MRRTSRKVRVGNIYIGGNEKITVQSMTNTNTSDISKTTLQILELEKAGCEIVRVAVPNLDAANAISEIKKNIHIPLVADIHFDYKLALKSMENGIDALRINPGNIGSPQKVKEVVSRAKYFGIPIRVGVNAGSLEKDILARDGRPTPEGLVESALRNVELLEDNGFYDTVISVKSSNVMDNIKSYELLAKKTDYPLHLGVTEAGTIFSGTIKSSVAIGHLLAMGIGDTIRVSLTDNPVEEIRAGIEILKALNLRKGGIEIISCPTCGRTQIDLINIAKKAELALSDIDKNIKVAIMGCAVNGPGEAREADIGIAGGIGEGLIFKKGEIVKKVPEDKLLDTLIEEIKLL
ncbi:flavodoxin-dependent (E)-4-hydroxy-3-methylbut-2-enyl-diphosphate synthase [Clostridium cylindrosporum]|uniref:4-hydroxy-3-methylbut-2-en-1-yl diphosphate synthase (flavodoxin) n=1 Tax=Clostridium cylindrosporum DSM 605 TaxID=1121307 RepID=A0A0J8DFR2_CLOCY|nr:flavodoxin-dependent (E)-4-hydroxy-3-methylbut-2-enyl-diphosphate synthase [Clostridium cylindrosporum]KMT23074.1 4-hydroxy-3-methylbut-2-en-1-yl diphosphate synthase IspG [Clostridium cylindrosporum DSM 605]